MIIKLVVVKIPILWIQHFEDIRILNNYCFCKLISSQASHLLPTENLCFPCVFMRSQIEKSVILNFEWNIECDKKLMFPLYTPFKAPKARNFWYFQLHKMRALTRNGLSIYSFHYSQTRLFLRKRKYFKGPYMLI